MTHTNPKKEEILRDEIVKEITSVAWRSSGTKSRAQELLDRLLAAERDEVARELDALLDDLYDELELDPNNGDPPANSYEAGATEMLLRLKEFHESLLRPQSQSKEDKEKK